jgi:hypothetical protein
MKYRKHAHISLKTVENEVFVFNRTNAVIHSFNGSGGFLFKHIATNAPIESLVAAMVNEYDVDENTAARDIISFLKSLSEKGLVEIDDE